MLSMQRTFVATLTRLLLSALLTAGRHAVSLQGWIRRLQDPQPEDFAARGLDLKTVARQHSL